MEDNINITDSIIFTSDRLTVSFLQRGFEVANLDWTLSQNYSHPMVISQKFILESPWNCTYLTDFFSNYPRYAELEIYVIWGVNDAENPLSYLNAYIPVDQYETSEWYVLEYSGWSEIQSIYRFDITSFYSYWYIWK